uniref:Tumor necrosis factor receptor superfamily member 5-like n=1 Tax=Labrus bergylta TaxID=56723 RepID=A0A3Q3FE71_9LABR|nr:tumor necrosis factor receptor superfamily member 5-like [Labrus bergylta]XP_029131414.1 tumor necrosis factor receptor superfamily member 5-like [Labrus bergylta]XP_029131415.1 tumor necrosis factor receptor superfamily member 5-like [Labrus bergylta]
MRPGSAAVFLILLLNVSTGQTLTCGRYEYETPGGCCPVCPAGGRVYENCTDSESTHCKPCTEGTFMDHPTYRTRCYDCKSCDEGSALKMKTSCAIVSDTVCEPVEGFYCSDSRKDDCVEAKKHRRCEPGEYIREHGTSSTDTVCSTCSDGTFSDGTFTSCQNHKQCESEGLLLLRAGTETEDAQCGGKVSHRTAQIICGVGVGIVGMFLVSGLGGFYVSWRRKNAAGNKRHSGPSDPEDVNLREQTLKSLMSDDSKESKGETVQTELLQSESSPGSCSGPAAGS